MQSNKGYYQSAAYRVLSLLLVFSLSTLVDARETKNVYRLDKAASEALLNADPIYTFGHGKFFDRRGRVITIDREFIHHTQAYYLERLRAALAQSKNRQLQSDVATKEVMIYSLVDDAILADALVIEVLLDNINTSKNARVWSINNGLRRYYIEHLQTTRAKTIEGVYSRGLSLDTARRLKENGVEVLADTNAGGEDYIRECEEAGVPIPPPMFSKAWTNRNTFDTEFISEDSLAELWLYESDAPEGACLALPRYYETNTNVADLLGIICLGRRSSKACFWDNPNGPAGDFPRNVEVDISKFVGGADLPANGQGTCTDCHAGENPFVVHPDVPAFAGLTAVLSSDDWHEPLVVPSWPQNPGPLDLTAINSAERCDSCHTAGYAGRFPDVTQGLYGYCAAVLTTSLLGDIIPPTRAIQTMPQAGSFAGHINHIDYLLSLCYGNDVPGGGGDDDREVLSPPIVLEPLYACATQVSVSGTILDADVTLFLNGGAVDTQISRSPSNLVFDVPALNVGDVLMAQQVVDGMPSGMSNSAIVRDHKVDFPAGLPQPDIDPDLIYECGHTIAVRHIPGAKLRVWVNGGNEASRNTSTGWSGIYPGKRPFDLGDEFTAQVSLCSDDSPISDPEYAVAAPAAINAPKLDPQQTYAGQQLLTITDILHGAMVNVEEAATGPLGKFSTPVSWVSEWDIASPLGRPLAVGDQVLLQQTLCDEGPVGETPPTRECDEIPAPKIRIPFDGDTSVIVTESVPGARIRVFDGSGNEIGDGSGNQIALTRALMSGETIVVTQQVGECYGRTGYSVRVLPRPVRKEDRDRKGG